MIKFFPWAFVVCIMLCVCVYFKLFCLLKTISYDQDKNKIGEALHFQYEASWASDNNCSVFKDSWPPSVLGSDQTNLRPHPHVFFLRFGLLKGQTGWLSRGCPQGSSFGPLFWHLFQNGMTLLVKDTNVFIISWRPSAICNRDQHCIFQATKSRKVIAMSWQG